MVAGQLEDRRLPGEGGQHGETIAFVAGRWPKSAIYLMDADGGNLRKIVN